MIYPEDYYFYNEERKFNLGDVIIIVFHLFIVFMIVMVVITKIF